MPGARRILAALQVRKDSLRLRQWEVSAAALLQRPAGTVGGGAWPAVIRERTAVCYATPDMPPALPTTAAAADWMKPGMEQARSSACTRTGCRLASAGVVETEGHSCVSRQ